MMLSIEEKVVKNEAFITLSGNMIDSSSYAVNEMVKDFISDGIKQVTIDLENVRVMNSCFGLGVIMGCWGSLARVGGRLRLENPSSKVSSLLKITKLDQILDVHIK